jgi:hypothetical protein
MSLLRYLKIIVGALAILSFGIFISYIFYSLTLSENAKLKESYARMQSTVDFDSIRTWVIDCWGVSNYKTLPLYYQELLSYYSPSYYLSEDEIDKLPDELPTGKRQLYSEERAILILNRSLSFTREYYKLQAHDLYVYLQLGTLLSIAIGMLTTIFVSISSTEFGRGEGRPQKSIRVAAIILPILGTAVSGVMAFYAPAQSWNQAARTLASISQLHAQMSVAVSGLKCIDPQDKENVSKAQSMLNDWSKRYVDIQTVAAAVGGPPSTSGKQ